MVLIVFHDHHDWLQTITQEFNICTKSRGNEPFIPNCPKLTLRVYDNGLQQSSLIIYIYGTINFNLFPGRS